MASITPNTITHTLKTMKNNAPGHTNINKMVLTNLPDDAISILSKLLNISLSSGLFPQAFKTAKIKLIPKPNKNSTIPSNYRPISLLEVPGKIYEKILNKRLLTHLETNNLLPPNQHGFRKHRSTDTALAVTTEIISDALANKNQCCLVLRDVSKAFDKVWHNGLRYKLHHLNIPSDFTRILSNYLENRTAYIALNNHDGPTFDIYSGVPQGSSISPTLYAIYTADTPQPSHNSHNITYADDITQIIIQPGKSRKLLAEKIEKEITNINNFEYRWKIKTNTNKFTLLPLAIRKTEPVTVNNIQIPYSNSGKILGFHLNTRGCHPHIRHNRSKANNALASLKRFRHLPPRIKLHLVKAFILPLLTYPAYPLNAISRTQLLSLQRIQNKSLRFALDAFPYNKTVKDLHTESNTEPLNITLHKRGNKIKDKLINILQDDTYNHIYSTYQDTASHGWFKKPIQGINTTPPPPILTSIHGS